MYGVKKSPRALVTFVWDPETSVIGARIKSLSCLASVLASQCTATGNNANVTRMRRHRRNAGRCPLDWPTPSPRHLIDAINLPAGRHTGPEICALKDAVEFPLSGELTEARPLPPILDDHHGLGCLHKRVKLGAARAAGSIEARAAVVVVEFEDHPVEVGGHHSRLREVVLERRPQAFLVRGVGEPSVVDQLVAIGEREAGSAVAVDVVAVDVVELHAVEPGLPALVHASAHDRAEDVEAPDVEPAF